MTSAVAEIQEKVSHVLRRYGVVRAFLFGSVVRGKETPESDVDFLVEFEERRTLLDLSGLKFELQEVLGREVDVVTPGSVHPRLKDRILEEQVEIL